MKIQWKYKYSCRQLHKTTPFHLLLAWADIGTFYISTIFIITIVQPQIIWLIAEMFVVGGISLYLVSLTIEYMIIAVLFYTDTLHIFDKK